MIWGSLKLISASHQQLLLTIDGSDIGTQKAYNLQIIIYFHLCAILLLILVHDYIICAKYPNLIDTKYFILDYFNVKHNIFTSILNAISSVITVGLCVGFYVLVTIMHIKTYVSKSFPIKTMELYKINYYFALIISLLILYLCYIISIILQKDVMLIIFTKRDFENYCTIYSASSFFILFILYKRLMRYDSTFITGVFFVSILSIFLYPLTIIKIIYKYLNYIINIITYLIGIGMIGMIVQWIFSIF